MNIGNYFIIFQDYEDDDYKSEIETGELPTGRTVKSYICKHKENEGMYRVILSLEVNEEMIVSENKRFSDFVEDFFISPYYCSVFCYLRGERLSDKLRDPLFSITQRREILTNVLKSIITKNIPKEFSNAILSAENIIISNDGEIGFNYQFPQKTSFSEVLLSLAKLTGTVLENCYGEETERWLQELKSNAFMNLCEAYYKMVFDEPLTRERTTPHSYKDFLERLKGLLAIVSAFLIPIILAVLVYVLLLAPKDSEERGNITTIGSISVESDSNE